MTERLTRADVERIAALAHLELSEAEVELFTRQLAAILDYAAEIERVDTTGVPPTAHVLATSPVDRADEVHPSLPLEETLRNAPDPALAAGLFRVPRVIG